MKRTWVKDRWPSSLGVAEEKVSTSRNKCPSRINNQLNYKKINGRTFLYRIHVKQMCRFGQSTSTDLHVLKCLSQMNNPLSGMRGNLGSIWPSEEGGMSQGWKMSGRLCVSVTLTKSECLLVTLYTYYQSRDQTNEIQVGASGRTPK